MPIINISSVGTGKDYTTWTLWEAATDNDLVTQDRIEIGEGYAETLTEAPQFFGAITDATRYRIARANSTAVHGGVFGSGHVIQIGGGAFTVSEANFLLQDMTIRHSGTGTYALNMAAGPGYVERCFVSADVGSTVTYAVMFEGGGHIRSSLVVGYNVGIAFNSTAAGEASNCTVIGRTNIDDAAVPAFGIYNLAAGVVTAKNCVVDGFTRCFIGTITQSNNASRDGGAAGAGSLKAQIQSDTRFRASANLDFVPVSSSALAGAGADLSANFNYDIAGNTMPAAWPIGAYAPAQVPTFAGAASAADNTDGSVLVSWVAATAVVSAIRGYKIHVHTAAMTDADLDANTYLLTEVPSGRTSVDVWTLGNGLTALTAGTTYYFAVRAISAAGDEDQNATNVNVVVTSGEPSSLITGTSEASSTTSVVNTLLTWPSTIADRWKIFYRLSSATEWTESAANTTLAIGQTITITGLLEGSEYQFAFVAATAGKNGDMGVVNVVSTPVGSSTSTPLFMVRSYRDLSSDVHTVTNHVVADKFIRSAVDMRARWIQFSYEEPNPNKPCKIIAHELQVEMRARN